jgi:hypothetical protein
MTTTTTTLGNPRAELIFVNSGLADELRPVVSQEAHYIMNCTGSRFSDAVSTACWALTSGSGLASPVAKAMLAEVDICSECNGTGVVYDAC